MHQYETLLDEIHIFSTLRWCFFVLTQNGEVCSGCLHKWNLLHELHVAGSVHDDGWGFELTT